MPDWLNALLVGILQGLTEYLPVSSSGHIELGQAILGYEVGDAQAEATFSVVLHLATVLSTVVVLRQDIADIFKGLFQFKWNAEFEFALKVVLSMIPAALAGLFLEKQLEALFAGQILLVGLCLWVTATLLFFANRAQSTDKDVSYRDAFIIGVAQMIAILPGVSRSGATISTSVLLQIDKARAARFSFLMVIPLILGKMCKDLLDNNVAWDALGTEMLIGFVSAFVVGILACRLMLDLVKRGKLIYFSVYCFIVGSVAIAYSLL